MLKTTQYPVRAEDSPVLRPPAILRYWQFSQLPQVTDIDNNDVCPTFKIIMSALEFIN